MMGIFAPINAIMLLLHAILWYVCILMANAGGTLMWLATVSHKAFKISHVCQDQVLPDWHCWTIFSMKQQRRTLTWTKLPTRLADSSLSRPLNVSGELWQCWTYTQQVEMWGIGRNKLQRYWSWLCYLCNSREVLLSKTLTGISVIWCKIKHHWHFIKRSN